MAESESTTLRSGLLESLQERSSSIRRSRPPDITIVGDEDRIPLRADRLTKRGSKAGLRNIFSRSKAGKGDKGAEDASSIREPPRSGGIRASLAEISNWPYKLHSARSEASLLSPPLTASRHSSGTENSPPRSRQASGGSGKPLPPTPPSARGSATTWDPPPLFQVYPQAIKHATLPACNASVEALTRISETRNSLLIQDDWSPSSLALDQVEESLPESKGGTLKRRQRTANMKNSLEWTSKTYVLATSGCLLQYSAEGPFDRLPEKILQLTKESAAYASDLIPGKHYVLQVASTTDADGNPCLDSKSLRSKLSLRGHEKRHVSNALLVFDGPELMDSWLATLRREIESLGGKKKLSETGNLEIEDIDTSLKAQPSQNTLVLRDPERFSPIIPQDFSWTQENALVDPMEAEFGTPRPEQPAESTHDDGSNASLVSSDDQQLDSLRNSGGGNRSSYVSSGQRTIVTSTGSSPASSPIRESFSSYENDFQGLPSVPEVRPRPNAVAISNRRQSMQPMAHGFEPQFDTHARPHSTISATSFSEDSHQYIGDQQHIPNFSVPVNRRFSSLNTPPIDTSADHAQTLEDAGLAKAARKLPPRTLALSRPLSVVLDQPSPRSPHSPGMSSKNQDQKSSIQSAVEANDTSPRYSVQSSRVSPDKSMDGPEHIPRASSSLGSYGTTHRLSTAPAFRHASYKRSTFLAENTSSQTPRYPFANTNDWGLSLLRKPGFAPPATCSTRRSASSLRTSHHNSSSQLLNIDAQTKALMTRRSMPQLAEGPPPAPPPTCALPPIPKKHSNTPRGIKA